MRELKCGHCGVELSIPHDHPVGSKSLIDIKRVSNFLDYKKVPEAERAVYRKVSAVLVLWANAEFARIQKEGTLL